MGKPAVTATRSIMTLPSASSTTSSKKRVRFTTLEPLMGSSSLSCVDDAFECWYTSQDLMRMGANVRLDCCRFLESLHRQRSRGTTAAIPNDCDSDGDREDDSSTMDVDDNALWNDKTTAATTNATTGLEPYVDSSRGRLQTETIRALLKHAHKIKNVEARLQTPQTRNAASLLLAEVSRRLSRNQRLRAFEEGHVLYCELYPERVMGEGTTGHWEAYRRILQRQTERHAQLYRSLLLQQQPKEKKNSQNGGSGEQTLAPPAIHDAKQAPNRGSTVMVPHLIVDEQETTNLCSLPIMNDNNKRRRVSTTSSCANIKNNVVDLIMHPEEEEEQQRVKRSRQSC